MTSDSSATSGTTGPDRGPDTTGSDRGQDTTGPDRGPDTTGPDRAWGTHTVLLGSTTVTKRHRGQDAARRAAAEWRALDVLHRHAPGLAPEPLSPRPTRDRPEIVMSRLGGAPLRGTPIDAARLRALAAAVDRIHTAVPSRVPAGWAPRDGLPHQLAAEIRDLAPHVRARASGGTADRTAGPRPPATIPPDVAEAVDEGLAWLASAEPLPGPGDRPPVVGHGDGNLANYLWDGTRVAVVDFEFSGASERALELAEITEHIAAWSGPPLDADAFLACFAPDPDETRRLRALRRLLALHWLCRLALDDPAAPRNPPGTAARQAARLMELLARA
ncbi:phosphotransferase family protein [Streptomyces sp. NPDC020917]|uniref:phosphotransferase family protein n=1 Tax=Streptomyces sp. NPDC020917 TaxID=3365102 RepID=UPI0037B452B1